MYVVVCYDITSNRHRIRLHQLLLGYGSPVQKSVFECSLTHQQLQRLRRQAQRLARGPSDSIRYYQLCRQCQDLTGNLGTRLIEADLGKDFIL